MLQQKPAHNGSWGSETASSAETKKGRPCRRPSSRSPRTGVRSERYLRLPFLPPAFFAGAFFAAFFAAGFFAAAFFAGFAPPFALRLLPPTWRPVRSSVSSPFLSVLT